MLQPLPLASMLDFSHSPDVKESLSLLGCFSEDIVPVKLWDLVCPWEEVSSGSFSITITEFSQPSQVGWGSRL